MFDKVINNCKEIANTAIARAKEAVGHIHDKCTWLGRKIEVLATEHVYKPGRRIYNENRDSLPYTAALSPFAVIGIGPLAAGVALLAVRVLQNDLNQKTALDAYQGIRNFCVLGAGLDTVRSAVMLNPFFLISLPFYLLVGALAQERYERTLERAVI